MGDRQVRKYKPAAHHAALIVNAAMTFSNFIFDTYTYQRPGQQQRNVTAMEVRKTRSNSKSYDHC